MCCINYKASSWCPCKFYCVLCDVSRLQPLLVSMSACSIAQKVVFVVELHVVTLETKVWLETGDGFQQDDSRTAFSFGSAV